MNINNIISIDDFIKLKYPEPAIDNPDYAFFKQWGYEQYLIKKYQYNIEGLKALEQSSYNEFRVIKMFDGKNLADVCKGFPIVKSKKILTGFLTQSAYKGMPGICLWQENDKYFCIFPGYNGLFKRLMRLFDDSEIEITDQVFTTEENIISMIDKRRICSCFELENHVCFIPDIGNCYVFKTWSNDFYRGSFSVDYTMAEYDDKKKKWTYVKGKKNHLKLWNVQYTQIEDALILD